MKTFVALVVLFWCCIAKAQLAPNSYFVTGVATDTLGVGTYTYYPITANTLLGFNGAAHMYPVLPSTFATYAQGLLAGTAIQPNGNISVLTNDSGYITITALTGYATTSSVTVGLATKFNIPVGTTAQYIRGEGSLAAFPSIPAAQVSSDWNASSGVASILNKPTIPAAQVQSDWSAVTGAAVILNKPSLATVAMTGAYSDLTGKPTLGTAAAQASTAFDASGAASTAQAAAIAACATAAQGVLAASAVQAGTLPLSVSGTTMAIAAATDSVAGSMSAADKTKLDGIVSWSFTNGATRTIQTVAAAGNGWQLSATRNATAGYSVSISTTTSIGGPAAGYVVLEVCSTNSSTAASWTEIARTSNSQTATLAIALQLVTVNGSAMMGVVPAGYYVRLRSVVSSGTVSFAYLSGQEVLQ